jgi:hypothetical protein
MTDQGAEQEVGTTIIFFPVPDRNLTVSDVVFPAHTGASVVPACFPKRTCLQAFHVSAKFRTHDPLICHVTKNYLSDSIESLIIL